MRTRILRESAPADSGGGSAAAVVKKSEADPEDAAEIVKLKRENADLHGKVKEREQRIASLEDENGQLKRLPAPATTPAKKTSFNADEWLY